MFNERIPSSVHIPLTIRSLWLIPVALEPVLLERSLSDIHAIGRVSLDDSGCWFISDGTAAIQVSFRVPPKQLSWSKAIYMRLVGNLTEFQNKRVLCVIHYTEVGIMDMLLSWHIFTNIAAEVKNHPEPRVISEEQVTAQISLEQDIDSDWESSSSSEEDTGILIGTKIVKELDQELPGCRGVATYFLKFLLNQESDGSYPELNVSKWTKLYGLPRGITDELTGYLVDALIGLGYARNISRDTIQFISFKI